MSKNANVDLPVHVCSMFVYVQYVSMAEGSSFVKGYSNEGKWPLD